MSGVRVGDGGFFVIFFRKKKKKKVLSPLPLKKTKKYRYVSITLLWLREIINWLTKEEGFFLFFFLKRKKRKKIKIKNNMRNYIVAQDFVVCWG